MEAVVRLGIFKFFSDYFLLFRKERTGSGRKLPKEFGFIPMSTLFLCSCELQPKTLFVIMIRSANGDLRVGRYQKNTVPVTEVAIPGTG